MFIKSCMPAPKHHMADLVRNRGSRVKTTKAPIMYNRSDSPDALKKSFNLALAYALSVGRQVDLAQVCGVYQSTISMWCNGRLPRVCNMAGLTRKLVAFVNRRSRKGVA